VWQRFDGYRVCCWCHQSHPPATWAWYEPNRQTGEPRPNGRNGLALCDAHTTDKIMAQLALEQEGYDDRPTEVDDQ
jgi:hypothetical protein